MKSRKPIATTCTLTGLIFVAWSVASSFQTPPDDVLPVRDESDQRVVSKTWEPPPQQVANRSHVQNLSRIVSRLRDGNPNQDYYSILNQLQRILQAADDSFVTADELPSTFGNPVTRRPKLRIESIKSVAERLLNELPEAGQIAYAKLFSAEAASKLKQAQANGDLRLLEEIAGQHFHTPSGYRAAYILGNRQLDQDRHVSALGYFLKIRSSHARARWEPLLSLKITGAWLQLGRQEKARESFSDLVTFAKTRNQVQQKLQALLETVKRTKVSPLDQVALLMPHLDRDAEAEHWVQFMGTASRTGEPEPFCPVGTPVWKTGLFGLFNDETGEELTPDPKHLLEFHNPKDDRVPRNKQEMVAAIQVGLDRLAVRELRSYQPAVPATYPIVANGIAVFRTLNRVRAVEVATGELLWETFTEDSGFLDQFDLGSVQSNNSKIPRQDLSSPLNRYQEAFLTTRTRTDRTAGTLTTDGKVVYYVEGNGIPNQQLTISQRRIGQSKINSYNRLCAVELDSGLILWEIGGPRNEFSLPSAGRYFLGPPTIVDDKLYVIVEEDAEIRLLNLDPVSGKQIWVQSISQPSAGVEFEAVRRLAGDMPTFVDGLIVCPTTSGQVVAYDVAQRRFAWSYQYDSLLRVIPKDRRIAFRGGAYLSTNRVELGTRWVDSAMISHSGRILFTPLDNDSLICLDAQTGQELWQHPRQDGMYLAGVQGDSVLVVETTGIRCLDLTDGEQQWFVPLENRRVCGRGLRTGHILHIPISRMADVKLDPTAKAAKAESSKEAAAKSAKPTDTDTQKKPAADSESGKEKAPKQSPAPDTPEEDKPQQYRSELQSGIVSIDINTGVILTESSLPLGMNVGNFAASNGTLVAQSFDQVIAFESLPVMTARIDKKLNVSPDDAQTLALKGQLAFHRGDVDTGLNTLTRAVMLNAGPQAEADLLRAILERLRFGGELPADAVKLLEKSATGLMKLTVQQIQAEAFARKGQYELAFKTLLDLAAQDEARDPRFSKQIESATVSGIRWIGGRLRAVYETAKRKDPEAAKAIDQLVAAELKRVVDTNQLGAYERWIETFPWHPSAVLMRENLADAFDPETELTRVERHLQAAIRSSQTENRRLQLKARLLELWATKNSARALNNSIDSFASAAGELQVDGKSAQEWVAQWETTPGVKPLRGKVTWKRIPGIESKANSESPRLRNLPVMVEPRSPALKGLTIELDTYGSKMFATNEYGATVWEVDINRLSPSNSTRRVRVTYSLSRVFSNGHIMVLSISMGSSGLDFYVYDISGEKPELLWNRLLTNTTNKPATQANIGLGRVQFVSSTRTRASQSFDALTNEYIVYRIGTTLFVADVINGTVVWQRANVPTTTRVLADDGHICLLKYNASSHNILSLYDGHVVKATRLPSQTLLHSDGMNLTFQVLNHDNTVGLISFDAVTGKTNWKAEYPYGTRSWLIEDSDRIVAADKSGLIQIRSVVDGKVLVSAKGEAQDTLSQVIAWSGPDHYVVFLPVPSTDRSYPRNLTNLGTPQYRVHGLIYGINKSTGEIDWTRDAPNTLFHTKQPSKTPVLVFACYKRDYDAQLRRYSDSRSPIMVIDTRTGDTLFESEEKRTHRQFQTIASPADQQVKVVLDGITLEFDYNKDPIAE